MVIVPRVKITAPHLPSGFVERAGLGAALGTGATSDVTLVCAPAGYGKTLLLADWSRTNSALDTAWVSIDHDDNDPSRLWAAVTAAVAGCQSVPRSSRLHALRSWHPDTQPEFVAEFTDALSALPRPIRLVLDDLHALVSPLALQGIHLLSRIKPATLQLVLSSRVDPPLALPRLRMEGRLRELRAEQLALTIEEASALLTAAGVRPLPEQVEVLHSRTGGWAAGLRLAARGLARCPDSGSYLAEFLGNDRAVADYLFDEVLFGLPDDARELLQAISISRRVPTGLAVTLFRRDGAIGMLDRLGRQSLVTAAGPPHEGYRVLELLRTYLLAELHRQNPGRAQQLHTRAARWWEDHDEPGRAFEHSELSGDRTLVTELLHRFAVSMIVNGQHALLRRALIQLGPRAVAADARLSLVSALVNGEACEFRAAQNDLHSAHTRWPPDASADLHMLREVAEQFAGRTPSTPAPESADQADLFADPGLQALAMLSRGSARLHDSDLTAARSALDDALDLSRRHGFDHVTMQVLTLLGVTAATSGDLRAMGAMSAQARDTAIDHGWQDTRWFAIATAMAAYTALLRSEPAAAEHLADGAIGPRTPTDPTVRYAVHAVHGAARFDRGERATGLAELQQARSEFGSHAARPRYTAAMAALEFRAALLLGHTVAARTVLGWLAERTDDNAELLLMRALIDATTGHDAAARALLRPILESRAPSLLPHTRVDAWLLETSLAVNADERQAARRALRKALAAAVPLDAFRPFAQAGKGVRTLLVHQLGSFGASDSFAHHAVTVGAEVRPRQAALSDREHTILELLPSMMSLNEIANELNVSINTIKTHLRSLYTKLGVSSRRFAVLVAYENGLVTSGVD